MTEEERKPEPSYGPDEEGEVPLKPEHIPKKDKAAWVHEDKRKRHGGTGQD
ncbi:MAG: hypothetical protein U5M50_03850 [Sphingobium sp.]|nr:hypothetical protein [Sphingobium sp.]